MPNRRCLDNAGLLRTRSSRHPSRSDVRGHRPFLALRHEAWSSLLDTEEFVSTCTAAGVTDVVTPHGDFNLGNGDGLLVARLLAAVAANGSDAKARRGPPRPGIATMPVTN